MGSPMGTGVVWCTRNPVSIGEPARGFLLEDTVNAVIPFQFQGHDVRIVDQDGNPWFVAIDVGTALGLKDTRTSVHSLDPDDRHSMPVIDSMGRMQKTAVINESGLYQLIFQSRRKEAKEFKKWVTSEVLPSIRKNGSYGVLTREQRIAQSLVDAVAMLEEQKPAVEFYNAVTDSKDAISMDEVAKVLDMGMGRNRLFEFLRYEGLLMHNNVPYQRYIDQGLFRVIEQHWTDRAGEVHVSVKTLVYQKGVERIRSLIEKMVN